MTTPSRRWPRSGAEAPTWRVSRCSPEPLAGSAASPTPTGSERHTEPPGSAGDPGEPRGGGVGGGWLVNLVMFIATVGSVFLAGAASAVGHPTPKGGVWSVLGGGASYAVPLMAILLCHEFGHYIAARLHRVPASLPYFIPLPVVGLFGTLGAVILMPRRIRSARAVLDIGAAGPLAGMAVAIPLMVYGLSLSEVRPQSLGPYVQEGQSLLYMALKYLVHGHIPPGYDVFLHPTAFAAWTGFFITFINLLPYSQLDGGHVAYALLGERHHRIARWVLHLPPVLIVYNLATYLGPYLAENGGRSLRSMSVEEWLGVGSATQWLVLWGLLHLMRRFSGHEHPRVNDPSLGPRRRWVAVGTLVLFVLIFMPSPIVIH